MSDKSDPRRRIARQTAAVLAAILIVASISVAGVDLGIVDQEISPVGTASASHGGTDVDDFEDGDTTPKDSSWSYAGDTGSFSVESNDPIDGSFSGNLTSSGDAPKLQINRDSTIAPNRVALKIRASSDTDNSADRFNIELWNGSTKVSDLKFEDSGNDIEIDTGGSDADTGRDWEPGETLLVEFRNIDYANDKLDVYINGSRHLKNAGFRSSASNLDGIRIQSDTNTAGTDRTITFDDVEIDGSNYTGRETLDNNAFVDDFEDSDNHIEHNDWDGWDAAVDSNAEITTTTSPALSGSVSGNFSTKNNNGEDKVRVYSTRGDRTPKQIQIIVQQQKDHDIEGDDTAVYIQSSEGPGRAFGIRMAGGDGSCGLQSLGCFALGDDNDGIGVPWNAGVKYNLTFSDIDWSGHTFDFSINGTKYADDRVFTDDNNGNNYSSMNELYVQLDTASSGKANAIYLDDLIIADSISSARSGGGSSSGDTVSGTVVNQNGKPINNATVQVIGVDYDQLTPSADEVKDQLANNELTDALNKTSTVWENQLDDDFQLLGPSGHFDSVDTTYVAVHERSDWLQGSFGGSLRDPPQLTDPVLTTAADSDQTCQFALSIWDPSEEQSAILENDVDEQLPGKPTTGKVTIETLLAKDSAFETTTARVQFTEGGVFGNLPGVNIRGTPEEYENAFVLVTVTSGFYEVHPEDNEKTAYVVKCGNPIELITDDLENADGDVSDQAATVAEKLNSGVFTRTTTTSNSTGGWSVDVGSAVNRVEVQAYKSPDVEVNSTDLTAQEIVEKYRDVSDDDLGDLGSVYLPKETKRVSPPESGVEIELVELSYPPYGNTTKLGDKLTTDHLRQLVESLAGALGITTQPLDDLSRDELEAYYKDLVDQAENNNEVLDRARDDLKDETGGANGGGTTEVIVKVEEATDEELRERIESLTTALNQIEETVESGTPTSTAGQETVSLSFPFSDDLEEDGVMVLAHWSNGTTTRLDTSSEYVSIDDSFAGGDTVQITDYPLGENESNAVNFEVLVSTPDGIGRASKSVINPTFTNDVPEIKAISLTSLKPGSGEKVDLEIDPEDDAVFGSITSATVTGPDGADVETDAIGTDGLSTGFTTTDTGTYHVQLEFNNSDGDTFTETFRIEAAATDRARAATLRPQSGTTGVYALVGDGLDSGAVDTNADGSQVTLSAQVGTDQQVPATVHYHADDIGGAADTSYTLRVVKGDSEQSINRPVGVVLHSPSITSETPVIYRQSDQPIPREGSNSNGEISNRGNGTTIQSFSEDDGSVRIRVDNDPGYFERGWYRIRLRTQGVPVIGQGALLPPVRVEAGILGVGA